jgi:hypothetical protein
MKIFLILFVLVSISTSVAFGDGSNIGTIEWKKQIVSSNSFVDIIVKDDDMNKKEYPNFADKFSIFVWSETSLEGLEIPVVETGVYSGVFKGSVYIADSGETNKNRLVSMPGDILYAKYIDSTLPGGGSSEIVSAAIVKVSGQNMDTILSNLDSKFFPTKTSEKVPEWIKNNAGWWADGRIDDASFVNGIQFLIQEEILKVEQTNSDQKNNSIPSWVKNNAKWWSEGQIKESDFLSGINHLVSSGIISVSLESTPEVSETNSVLSECQSIKSTYKRLDCENEIKQEIEFANFKESSESFPVGDITYYFPGMGYPGNEFEISSSGQAMLRVRILAENTGTENISLKCTGPSICSYDVWDGEKAFKYSGMDFVSGQIAIKPGTSFIFNMMFGPNIGYGGTTFEYDPSKDYDFRINESWGSAAIPLNLN